MNQQIDELIFDVYFFFFFQKLFQIYVQNEIDYMFLDDMLKSTEQKIQDCARDSLTWLKRYVSKCHREAILMLTL